MITEDTALISVLGQNAGNQAKIVDRALLEAARATRDHGYRYFVILDAADASQKGQKLVEDQTLPAQIATARAFGQTNLSSQYLPGATYKTPDRRVGYVRLGLDLTIRMYRDGDVNPQTQGVWNPDVILGAAAQAPARM